MTTATVVKVGGSLAESDAAAALMRSSRRGGRRAWSWCPAAGISPMPSG